VIPARAKRQAGFYRYGLAPLEQFLRCGRYPHLETLPLQPAHSEKQRLHNHQEPVCPFPFSICSRAERKKAAWRLRAIDGREAKHHWMFVRKGKKYDKAGKCTDPGVVQPALKERLGDIQTSFETWYSDVSKRFIVLKKKHQGNGYFAGRFKAPGQPAPDMAAHLLPGR
jgi:hypothetical protein